MYKIFHENKALFFPKFEGNSLKLDATLQESDRYDAELLCESLPEWLKETFKMAPAAGGVVVVDGKFVSIVRKGFPDLPKGHIEKGETPEVAALREVEEETGIGKLRIIKELPSTWHCYLEHEVWTLKRTYWYLMESEETIQPKPQTEEGITEIKLIGNEEIEGFLKNTFRSTSEILGEDLRHVVTK